MFYSLFTWSLNPRCPSKNALHFGVIEWKNISRACHVFSWTFISFIQELEEPLSCYFLSSWIHFMSNSFQFFQVKGTIRCKHASPSKPKTHAGWGSFSTSWTFWGIWCCSISRNNWYTAGIQHEKEIGAYLQIVAIWSYVGLCNWTQALLETFHQFLGESVPRWAMKTR